MTGKKVLIADDNLQVRMLVKATLRAGDYILLEASDGETALQTAIDERPDLILLDVTMPKLDGFEVLHFLHARPETAGCRIVMLTTSGTLDNFRQAFEDGAVDYVLKPFEPAHLRQAVEKALLG